MIPQIRGTNRYHFRSGEWATLVGVEVRIGGPHGPYPEPRACFLVVFPDGATDAWVVYDHVAQYEFRAVDPGDKPHPGTCQESSLLAWGKHLADGDAV
jgi:hypothetical protein